MATLLKSLSRPPEVSTDELLDLLLISDQIDSSSAGMDEIARQIEEHFQELPGCIVGLPGLHVHQSSVIKNIGDSLMIRVRCSTNTLPALLSSLIEMQARLNSTPAQGNPVLLRILVMQLTHKQEYGSGKELKLFRKKLEVGLPWLNGSPRKMLWGDLFGPKINLAFRAASISVREPLIIIDEAIAERLIEDEVPPDGPFDVDVPNFSSLMISERLAFSPIKGLDKRYPFGIKTTTGWRGHLFLRSVTAKRPNNPILLSSLAREQQKYKSFTRFMWRGKPAPLDRSAWITAIREFQGGAPYFRNLFAVEHELELRRCLKGKSARVVWESPPTSNIHTGLIGVFAAPFESTYELLRERIFDRAMDLVTKTCFRYPISTIVYEQPDQKTTFVVDNVGRKDWYVLLFWRWVPEHRTNKTQNALILIDDLRSCSREFPFDNLRTGMVVGGEWDAYAILQPDASLAFKIGGAETLEKECPDFVREFKVCMARMHVDSLAVYLCYDPDAIPEETSEAPQARESTT